MRESLLPVRQEAVTIARRTIDEDAKGLPSEVRADVRLLVSELVGNSVRHAGLAEGEEIGLTVEISTAHVRVEVSDAGPGFEPVPVPSLERASGWGLHLVDRLADRWGVARDDRTRVWFEIDCA